MPYLLLSQGSRHPTRGRGRIGLGGNCLAFGVGEGVAVGLGVGVAVKVGVDVAVGVCVDLGVTVGVGARAGMGPGVAGGLTFQKGKIFSRMYTSAAIAATILPKRDTFGLDRIA